ncbi:MAG: sigma-70 family RNA polymerase sigma factor [Candidatus Hydrogenedentota bacterium]
MSDRSDWDLVALANDGDMDAFAELTRRYQRPVIHFCQRMVKSREDAEDIAQESFVRVFRYLDRLTPSAKFSTLLFGIARNLTLNFIRDAGRRGRGVTYSIYEDDEQERVLEDESLRPDRAARLNEIESMIDEGLSMLTPKHREVLVLRELNGLDYTTIAEIVRCRKGTVKSRLARARQQLRQNLEDLGAEHL